ncbi:CoA-binding protein [Alicyclobacillus curvatus]|jgi:uncharacterized protein|nr:CoA-binding protein [Alicyclobacillus curvatus]
MASVMTTTETSMADLLSQSHSVALLGVSPRPDTQSYAVAAYLQSQGYQLLPVTDGDDSIVGFPTVSSLGGIKKPVDLLSVFLNSEAPPSLKDDVLRLGVRAIWVEPGCSQTVNAACQSTGLPVYSHHCIMDDHRSLLGNKKN